MALVITHPSIASGGKQAIHMPIGDSKFLQNVNYDPDSQQMTVTMKNGGEYVYSRVTPDVMQAFQESRSKSEFYSSKIRGQFEGTRILDQTTGKKPKKKT